MTVHLTDAELTRDFSSVLARVRLGDEIVVEHEHHPVAVLKCIALLPPDSQATVDEAFASDVEAAIAAHREALEPPSRRH